MSKKSFIIHIDSLDVIDDLSDQQCAELFRAIKAHHKNENIELSAVAKIAFSPFKNQFIRDLEKYEKSSKVNSDNGRKGGKRTQANARTRKRPKANQADSVNDNVSDSVNGSDKEKDSKRFSPPSLIELTLYIKKMNLTIEATSFIDFYECKGWMVGKNKMKSWQAAARGWSKRNERHKNEQSNQHRSKSEQFADNVRDHWSD